MTKRIEVLEVKVGGDVTEALGGFDRVAQRAQKLGRGLQQVRTSLTKNLTVPILAASAAAVGLVVGMAYGSDQLLDLAEQTGLTTTALQEWRRVASGAGVETDVMARAAEQMTLRMSRGAEGSADLRVGLQQLGISLRDASGALRPMSDLVTEAVTKLSTMRDVTARNVLATKLFSRAATDLAPVLGLGADEITRLRGEAHALGLVIDRESLESANRFREQVDVLKQSISAIGNEIGLALIPTVSAAVTWIQDRVIPAIRATIDHLREADPVFWRTVGALAAVAAAAGPVVAVLGALLALLPSLIAGVAILVAKKAAILGLLGPIGLAIAAAGALAAAAYQVAKNWDWVVGQLTASWTFIKDLFFQNVEFILASLEVLTAKIPIVGDKVRGIRADFNRFADESLAKSGQALWEIEQRMTALPPTVITLESALQGVNLEFGQLHERAGKAKWGLAEALALMPRMAEAAEKQFPKVSESMGPVNEEIGIMQGAFATVFEDVITGTESIVAAFAKMADQVIRELARIIARLLAMRITMAIFGTAVGGPPGLISGLFVHQTGGVQTGALDVNVAGRQHGGPVASDTPYLVGERGPELFVPSSAGEIVPNGGITLRLDLSSLPAQPRAVSPDALALDDWWRRAFGALVVDAQDRGVFA